MERNKFAPIMKALNRLADVAVDEFFVSKGLEIGKIGILIHRKKNAYGYCYTMENWEVSGEKVREIALTPDCLKSGKDQILNTLLHECVHAYNSHNGIKDGEGRNHNKNFKKGCDLIGLGCEKCEGVGHRTSPELNSEECKQRFEMVFQRLDEEDDRVLSNLSELLPDVDEEKEKKKKDRNLLKYVCLTCGAKARAKKEANLICGDCMEQMVCEEDVD